MAHQVTSVNLLIELFIQATVDSMPDPLGTHDAAYWQARASLEVARQIERLEATIRLALCEWRERSIERKQ